VRAASKMPFRFLDLLELTAAFDDIVDLKLFPGQFSWIEFAQDSERIAVDNNDVSIAFDAVGVVTMNTVVFECVGQIIRYSGRFV